MANKTKILPVAETPVLGKLLHTDFPVDTDGLLGLEDAPEVYDLILRDLNQDCVSMNVQATADLQTNWDGAPGKERRP